MAIDGFQLIQQLADRVARLEYQLLVNGKPQPAEYHTFSDIEDVLNRHKAVNKPQFGWYEVHLSPFRFITVKFRPNQFVVRLKSSNTGNSSGRSMRETVLMRLQAGDITVETSRRILLAYGYHTSVLDGVADTAPARVAPEGGAV